METTVLIAAIVIFVISAGALSVTLRARMDAQTAALRQEMQNVLHVQAQTVATQVTQLTQSVTQQLGLVTGALQKGVTDSGMLVSKAQEAVAAELKGSREMLGKINQQLGEVHQAGRDLRQASQTLEMVLSGARTRGALGEVGLERMLADALPQAAYDTQHRFSTGAAVDAILRVGEKIVPVDSKFPLEAYRRAMEASGEGRDEARKEFAKAVRAHADSIAEKYILPDEGTLGYAFMFIPSEGVYYEFLMTEDAKGPLADYCRSRHVIAVSPNVFYAYLHTILMGLRGMQVEENARRLLQNLSGLQRQFEAFAEIYEKLGNHLRNAQQSYSDADRKLDRANASLAQMAQGALPDAAVQPALPLEPATKE